MCVSGVGIEYWNDQIRQIGIGYSVDGLIGLGGSKLNIQWMDWADQNLIFNSRNDQVGWIGIEIFNGWTDCRLEFNIQ
jgi:hypothetical protein